MGFAARVTRHAWRPGEKERHSTANDIRSLETSLAVLRRRLPNLGGERLARDRAEIERLEALLATRRADLAALG